MSAREWNAADALEGGLARIVELVRWASRAERIGAALWPLAAFAIAAAIVDAHRPMAPEARLGVDALWLLLAVRVPLGLLPSARARRAGALRAARLAEEAAGLVDNSIVAGLQLRQLATSTGEVRVALAERAVVRGAAALRDAQTKPIVRADGAKRQWLRVLIALVMLALFAAVMPRLVAAEAPRFLDPFGDHPPYSRTVFDVRVQPSPLVAGDDAAVRVSLSGVLPDALELAIVDGAHARPRVLERAPMQAESSASPPNAWSLVLPDIRKPVRFVVRGSTGRSRVHEVVPEMRPRVRGAVLSVIPPSYTGWSTQVRSVREGEDLPLVRTLEGASAELRVVTTIELADAESSGAGETTIEGAQAVQRVVGIDVGRTALSLRPYGESGLATEARPAGIVEAAADEPPDASISSPGRAGRRIIAVEGAIIPFAATGVDDVQIARMQLSWAAWRTPVGDDEGLNAGGASAFASASWGHAVASDETGIDLAALGASHGTTVELTVSATDNRPEMFGGEQRRLAGPVVVLVVDQATFDRMQSGSGESEPGEDQGEGDRGGQTGMGGADLLRMFNSQGAGGAAGQRTDEGAGEAFGPDGEPMGDGQSGRGMGGTSTGGTQSSGGNARLVFIDAPRPSDDSSGAQGASSRNNDTRGPGLDGATPEDAEALRLAIESALGDGFLASGASLEGVPAGYRELVSRYFLRLAGQAPKEPDG